MSCLKCTQQRRTYYGLFSNKSIQTGHHLIPEVRIENTNLATADATEHYNMEMCTDCGTVWTGVCYEDIAGMYLFDAVALPVHVSKLFSNPSCDHLMLINDLFYFKPFSNETFNENFYYAMMKDYYLPALSKDRRVNLVEFYTKYGESLHVPLQNALRDWVMNDDQGR